MNCGAGSDYMLSGFRSEYFLSIFKELIYHTVQWLEFSDYFLESALMSTLLSKGLWLTLEKLFCPKFIFKFSFDKGHKQVS